MKQKFSCFLIDEIRDNRNQFFLALDLLQATRACICFDNATHALSYAAQKGGKPDYIFLHTRQPGLDGVRQLEALQQSPLLADVPVIFYAASFNPEDMTRMKFMGATDWMVKPSNLHALRDGLKLIFETVSGKQPASVPEVQPAAVLV
ncbi:Response regulator receiver domain-containing protein [Chitinophaga eiseniae]|uniref:Response regulator receiver domain-containing protein n=1 Tax=Chitinophaga eiseniae TaxID=634771 RepID=A0A1T4TR34_9BACT|nr:response regulator [Chitinophaga eiseniae]SKA42801.1 Response regulator receiver domain-containing protein [Chitinophaga eiseniae]